MGCPNCGGPLSLEAPDKSERVTCPNCNSLLDVNQGNLTYLHALAPTQKEAPFAIAQGCEVGLELLAILRVHVLAHGAEHEDRTGVGTVSCFGYQTRYDLREGEPVVVQGSFLERGGAILGDRVRMQGHATDSGIFIRSMVRRSVPVRADVATASARTLAKPVRKSMSC